MRAKRLRGLHDSVTIRRTSEGVPHIEACSWEDAFYALGWLHGRDRGGQIGLMRLLGQGRLCEKFADEPELFDLDVYFRRLGLARDARAHIDALDARSRRQVEAYCQGVNAAWAARPPWVLRLRGYRPEPFQPHDVLLLIKLLAFSGLAEAQRMGELFVIEAVRRGADENKLRELLPALDHLDVALIRNVRTTPPLFPGATHPTIGIPHLAASNNWVVSGTKTHTGMPILCNDPHLEVNRLPAIMYEVHLQVDDHWVHGATTPGAPGIVIGRTPFLAWGITYSFADTSDFFVERCRRGYYWREDKWMPFRQRLERILRKKHPMTEFIVYENDHGILEGDPTQEGDYLCWNWCGFGDGGLGTIKAFAELIHCRTVSEALGVIRSADIPTLHMVLADREGHIGYQLIGRVPRRRDGWSGLAPVAGWDAANDWRGWLDSAREVPSLLDPQEGFIATANEGRQHPDGPRLATIPQPKYRRDRIEELLNSKPSLTLNEVQAFQYDVLSPQARRLLPFLLPHVPPGPEREMLESWDLRYTPESKAATLFEHMYRAVLIEVFGEGGLGRAWMQYLIDETPLLVLLFGFFDDVLCREDSLWLPAERRDEILAQGVRAGLDQPIEPWGRTNAIVFQNIFFGGRLPRFLGFDIGPHPLPGGRATVHQGSKLRYAGRTTSFGPCYHFVTDLSIDESWTNLPGGPSESRFSRRYATDLPRWRRGEYKRI